MNDSINDVATAAPPRGVAGFVKTHRVALLVIGAALLIALAVVMAAQYQRKAFAAAVAHSPTEAVAVSVATVTPGSIEVRVAALGTVTSLANVTVRTQISGTLMRVQFKEGQLVHAGDVIAEIDPRPYEAALQIDEGNLKRDQALLADARLDLQRYEALVKEDSIATQQLDTQRALVDQYAGTLEADEGQIKTAQVNLSYTRIASPVTGRVGIRQVDQGNYVTPGDANGIVVINQLQPISVIFSIPEDNVTALMKQVHAGVTLPVEAYDRADAVKLADGTLSTVDNEIDTTTGTVKLRAQFANSHETLFPNQFVNVSLLLDELHDQLLMPTAAVRRAAPNGVVSNFVFLVKPDHTVTVRPVTLGAVDGERVAVVAGLSAGAVVVTEGGDRLRDGAKILPPQ